MSNDFITPLYLLLCAGAVGALHWRVWRHTVPAFRLRRFSRASCLVRVAGWQLAGLLVPAGGLLLLIGIEEVAKTPLVPERIALVTAGLTLLQLLGGFATFIAAVGRTHAAP